MGGTSRHLLCTLPVPPSVPYPNAPSSLTALPDLLAGDAFRAATQKRAGPFRQWDKFCGAISKVERIKSNALEVLCPWCGADQSSIKLHAHLVCYCSQEAKGRALMLKQAGPAESDPSPRDHRAVDPAECRRDVRGPQGHGQAVQIDSGMALSPRDWPFGDSANSPDFSSFHDSSSMRCGGTKKGSPPFQGSPLGMFRPPGSPSDDQNVDALMNCLSKSLSMSLEEGEAPNAQQLPLPSHVSGAKHKMSKSASSEEGHERMDKELRKELPALKILEPILVTVPASILAAFGSLTNSIIGKKGGLPS